MEKEMRRKDRLLSRDETVEILEKGEHGVLASVSLDNQPYALPISYVYVDNIIYIHSALTGHKLDNIKDNNKVSFSVVQQGKPVFMDNDFSTYFASAIIFGKAKIVEDGQEKSQALKLLCEKYLPEYMSEFDNAMKLASKATLVVRIDVEKMSGKAKKEILGE